jgi:hypothetical protein
MPSVRCVRSLLKIGATGRFGALLLVFAELTFGSVAQTSESDVPGRETAVFGAPVGVKSLAIAVTGLGSVAVRRRV